MVDDAVEETTEADPGMPFVSIIPFIFCSFSIFFFFLGSGTADIESTGDLIWSGFWGLAERWCLLGDDGWDGLG